MMKDQRIFLGIIFLGIGCYVFFQQVNWVFARPWLSWPTILIIVGIAFLAQSTSPKSSNLVLPGIIFTGFGIHFHVVHKFSIWPDHIGIFLLIIALGLLLLSQRTGSGLGYGVLILFVAILLLFYDQLTSWLGAIRTTFDSVWKLWPIFFIILGIYLLFFKKK
jgi:hypothetical protein